MANTFRKVYKKTGNSGSAADYQLVGNIGVGGVELDIMKGATSSVDGQIGLVPKPLTGEENYILTGDGVWNQIDEILNESVVINELNTFKSNTPKIRSGTLVFTNNLGYDLKSYIVFSCEQLQTLFDVDTIVSAENTTVIFMNGDGVSFPNVEFFSYYDRNVNPDNNTPGFGFYCNDYYIKNGKSFRINYIAVYFG